MKKILKTILVGGFLASGWIGGCATEPGDLAQPNDTGEVAFDLELGAGVRLEAVG
jgi:hypothetical protein